MSQEERRCRRKQRQLSRRALHSQTVFSNCSQYKTLLSKVTHKSFLHKTMGRYLLLKIALKLCLPPSLPNLLSNRKRRAFLRFSLTTSQWATFSTRAPSFSNLNLSLLPQKKCWRTLPRCLTTRKSTSRKRKRRKKAKSLLSHCLVVLEAVQEDCSDLLLVKTINQQECPCSELNLLSHQA